MIGLLSSCNSELSEPNLENIPQETVQFIPVEETDEASIFPLKTASYTEFGIIGHGYDVTKDYAIEDGFSNKGQVIDIQKLYEAVLPNSDLVFIESGRPAIQHALSWAGSNASEYASVLTNMAGLDSSVPVFGGSIISGFENRRNAEGEFDGKEIYGSWEMSIKVKYARIFGIHGSEENTALINLRNKYLSETFKDFIGSNSPESIVKNFGTHVIVKAMMGVKFHVNYQAETDQENRRDLAANKLLDSQEPRLNLTFNEVYTWRTIGGDTSLAVKGRHSMEDGMSPTLNTSNWQNKVNDDNIVLIDFLENGLIPIYVFILDPIKKAEVKNYVDQYMLKNSVKLFNKKTNIHRFFGKKSNNHFYTTEPTNESLFGFDYEGVSFQAYTYKVQGTIPVKRFYNAKNNDHLFSILHQDGDYVFEKIAFYAYETQVSGTKPIFSSKKTKGNNTHQLLTADIKEHQNALKNGYEDEGIVFYAF
jgi:hypothetical protein